MAEHVRQERVHVASWAADGRVRAMVSAQPADQRLAALRAAAQRVQVAQTSAVVKQESGVRGSSV